MPRSHLTAPMVRALEQLAELEDRHRRAPPGIRWTVLLALEELGLAVRPRHEWIVTLAGELTLQAYRIGRSRWGAT